MNVNSHDEVALEFERLELKERELELTEGLPHLHGWPWYPWAREFFESTNRMCLLVAANQISKSSTQIRKAIDWATDQTKWKRLWRTRPRQFWYLYPSKHVATIEFEKKWVPEFLPRGKFKSDAVYGWDEEYDRKDIYAIHFKTGVSIYFKTYSQDAQDLQTGTCDAIFCDEELPEELHAELAMRVAATDGYFSMVFTATLGQEFWRCAMEEIGTKYEKFPDAWKKQVSMYDCLKYEDGSSSPWTVERIRRVEATCGTQAEIQKRVHGRFIVSGGLKYPSFTKEGNCKPGHPLPKDWHIYSGVDIGSGGETGHPAAIVFVAVAPDFRSGRVFKVWRGDETLTTDSDILTKYIELRGSMKMSGQYYDWQAKDFGTIASRMGEGFEKAEKSHAIGETFLNVLFKNKMLVLYEEEPEMYKLVTELTTLKSTTDKTKAKDDLADALRYACAKIPWDWSCIIGAPVEGLKEPEKILTMAEQREENARLTARSADEEIDEEFEEWNEYAGT